jgi:hypothetical protein
MSRKTSGEIVNATLLEVFVALTFIFLAFGIRERVRADRAHAEATRAVAGGDAVRRRADSLRLVATALGDTIAQRDSVIRVHGIVLLPDCLTPRTAIALVTILGNGTLAVQGTRRESGLALDRVVTIKAQEIGAALAEAITDGRRRRCQHFVSTRQSPATTYSDIYVAMESLRRQFRAFYPPPA